MAVASRLPSRSRIKSKPRKATPTPAPGSAGKRQSTARTPIAQTHPTILIDDRAGSKELVKHYPLDQCGVLCRLPSADASFAGNGPDSTVVTIGVEVKSIYDLISSIDTGRLQATQIPAMLDEYNVSWLLYYGLHRPGDHDELEVFRKGGWHAHHLSTTRPPVPYTYLENFLLMTTQLGINVKRVANEREAALWLSALACWWAKPWASKSKRLRTFDNSRTIAMSPTMPNNIHVLATMLAKLPGVGFERAVAAARHFGTMMVAVSADIDDWCDVPGIGKTVARAAVQTLRGQ